MKTICSSFRLEFRGSLIPHGYLHPDKSEHSEVQPLSYTILLEVVLGEKK